MAIVNLCLQICVVQPGITKLWNSLQKSQPIQQQFYEGGVGTALQGVVTDQVNITDYFDLNTNGLFGINWSSGLPTYNDQIPRFAFFYTDRLRMLRDADSKNLPQVDFFISQLNELMNGETCGQNAIDHANDPGVPLFDSTVCPSTYCPDVIGSAKGTRTETKTEIGIGTATKTGTATATGTACLGPLVSDCVYYQVLNGTETATASSTGTDTSVSGTAVINPADPICQQKIPNGFQLSDACAANSDPGTSNYTPYCDPCCQPLVIYQAATGTPGQSGYTPASYQSLRPTSCYPYTDPIINYPTVCFSKPTSKGCACSQAGTDPNVATLSGSIKCNDPPPGGECTTNNPYGSGYPYIYDSTFQNYNNGISFLGQFGRDQQMTSSLPLTSMGPNQIFPTSNANGGEYFPNGIYPFFWYMKHYSPEVDKILNAAGSTTVGDDQAHWCVSKKIQGGINIQPFTPPPGYSDLVQLTDAQSTTHSAFDLPYTCSGQNCCVNHLSSSASAGNAIATSSSIKITVSPTITKPPFTFSNFTITYNGKQYPPTSQPVPMSFTSFFTASVDVTENGGSGTIASVYFGTSDKPQALTAYLTKDGHWLGTDEVFPYCTNTETALYVTAIDTSGNQGTSENTVCHKCNSSLSRRN